MSSYGLAVIASGYLWQMVSASVRNVHAGNGVRFHAPLKRRCQTGPIKIGVSKVSSSIGKANLSLALTATKSTILNMVRWNDANYDYSHAAKQLGACLMHSLQCAGKFPEDYEYLD